MTEHTITVRKDTVRGEPRVGFRGMETLYAPSEECEKIVDQAREKFDLSALDDGTELATVVAENSPKHHVLRVDWKEP